MIDDCHLLVAIDEIKCQMMLLLLSMQLFVIEKAMQSYMRIFGANLAHRSMSLKNHLSSQRLVQKE